jgi:FkbM family methyltransferase
VAVSAAEVNDHVRRPHPALELGLLDLGAQPATLPLPGEVLGAEVASVVAADAAGARAHAPQCMDGVRVSSVERCCGRYGPGARVLVSRLRNAPLIGRALASGPVSRLASVRALARLVDPSGRFAIRELGGARRAAEYRVRAVDAHIVLRHNSSDVWTLNEIFYDRSYDPPAPVAAWLSSLERPPRVLDLGANVGMYGALVHARHPGASIVAFEPDPQNAALHRRCMALNGSPTSWRLVEACAASEDGTRMFAAAGGDESRVTADHSGMPVQARDVLPEMERRDLVKMDIEGSEWELLADPRFGSAPAVVLEYHPHLCPSPDSHGEAERLLTGAGYRVAPVFRRPSGLGALWAWKPSAQAPGGIDPP